MHEQTDIPPRQLERIRQPRETDVAIIGTAALLSRARRMRDACARYGVPLPAVALQFTVRHLAMTAAGGSSHPGRDHS